MQRRRHRPRPGASGLAGSLAAPPAAAAAADPFEWGACPAEVAAVAPLLQCGTVTVPLDYAEPDGRTIDVAVSRMASANPEKRRGILLTNPGGPGGSGLSLPNDMVNLGAPNSLLEAYDVIGVDPRGVGLSSPVDCKFTTDSPYLGNVPPWAGDDADVVEAAAVAKSVAEQCAANDTDGLMAHMSTANTARDLDSIRAALGEEKASFFGLSYGSALGAAYASMFPDTTDRVIVDSNTGSTALDRPAMRRFGLGAEQAWPDFAKWVADRDTAYGLGSTPAEVRETYFRLAEGLDENPVAGFDGKLFRAATFGTLYNEARYAVTAQGWQAIDDSDAAGIASWTTAAAPSPNSNFFSSFLAVTCNDSEWPSDLKAYQRSSAQDREKYPLFGGASGNIVPCAFWDLGPSEPQVAINDDGPANILIMQNQRDAATPLRGGQIFRKEFANRSRLVTVDANQHGVYIFDDNPCALNVGTAWLVDGELPAQDVKCKAATRSGLSLDSEGRQKRAETLRNRSLLG